MQQTTINFTASEVRQPVSLRERMRSTGRVINQRLDSKNDTYSRIADFAVTNRVVMRVNIVTVLLVIGAVAIAFAPLASLVSIGASAWLTYQYNHVKKGGKK